MASITNCDPSDSTDRAYLGITDEENPQITLNHGVLKKFIPTPGKVAKRMNVFYNVISKFPRFNNLTNNSRKITPKSKNNGDLEVIQNNLSEHSQQITPKINSNLERIEKEKAAAKRDNIVEYELCCIKYDDAFGSNKYNNLTKYTKEIIKLIERKYKNVYKILKLNNLLEPLRRELMNGGNPYDSLFFVREIKIIKSYDKIYPRLHDAGLSDKQICILVKETEKTLLTKFPNLKDSEYLDRVHSCILEINDHIEEIQQQFICCKNIFGEIGSDEAIRNAETLLSFLDTDHEFESLNLNPTPEKAFAIAEKIENSHNLNYLARDLHTKFYYPVIPLSIRTCFAQRAKYKEMMQNHAIQAFNKITKSPNHLECDRNIDSDISSPKLLIEVQSENLSSKKHIASFYNMNYNRISNTKFIEPNGEITTFNSNELNGSKSIELREKIISSLNTLSENDSNYFLFLEMLIDPEYELDATRVVANSWNTTPYVSHFPIKSPVLERIFVKHKNENGLLRVTGTYILNFSLLDPHTDKSVLASRKASVTFDFTRDHENRWHRSPPKYKPLENNISPQMKEEHKE
ncbi:MAG: hypothetical protein V4487_05860 [Chlamydiota bacterium]